MRKFKNKKTEEVVRYTTQGYYRTEEGVAIPSRFIEDSCDWEEVLEKNYEITRVLNVGGVTLDYKDGVCVKRSDDYNADCTMLLEQVLSNKGTKVLRVVRISDGEVFEVGSMVKLLSNTTVYEIKNLRTVKDEESIYCHAMTDVNNPVSTQFGQFLDKVQKVLPIYTTYDGVDRYKYQEEHWVINNTYAYTLETCSSHLEGTLTCEDKFKIFSSLEAALKYVESVKPKPLFKTEDGVDIFCGDSYWCVNTAPHLWSLFGQVAKKKTQLNKTVRAFSTEDLAKEFIHMNKPILTLEEVESVLGGKTWIFEELEKIAIRK